MALALNRYLSTAVLPLLTKCSALFHNLEDHGLLVDSLIQAIYRLSRAQSLTRAQRNTAEDCLLALCRWGLKLTDRWKVLYLNGHEDQNMIIYWNAKISFLFRCIYIKVILIIFMHFFYFVIELHWKIYMITLLLFYLFFPFTHCNFIHCIYFSFLF